ncbi:MAG: D-tyrosyl-tRNA(Tyr) deacylase [Bacillota bacterium]|nr:MAG: D-tyrosyl-tRNA(Tyr) deacylase [Bacillota bacterium]
MRAVVQRCRWARVTVGGRVVGEIGPGPGLVVLLGVGVGDGAADVAYLAEKTANLRIFPDAEGKMNLSILDIRAGGESAAGAAGRARGRGDVLVVSQFTLYGDARRGRRPSYSDAAPPEEADRLYLDYVEALRGQGLDARTGEFQAMMVVELANDGPVTILLDSRKQF